MAEIVDLTGDVPLELQAPRRRRRRPPPPQNPDVDVIDLASSQEPGDGSGGRRGAGAAPPYAQQQQQQQQQQPGRRPPSSLLIDLTEAEEAGPENLPRPTKRQRAEAPPRAEAVLQRRQDVQQDVQQQPAVQQQQAEGSGEGEETFSCMICFDDVSVLFQHAFGACGHAFCLPCIREYVSGKVADRTYPVPCPLPDCKAPISAAECDLVLTPEEQEALGKMEAEAAVGEGARLYCPNPKCSMLLVADDKRADQAIACPYCDQQLCSNCGVAWHEGMTCQQYQAQPDALRSKEDKALLELAEKEGMRRCPACGTMVQRTQGCSYMSCRCGANFCYGCGQRKKKGSNHFCGCKPEAEQWLNPPAHIAAHYARQQQGVQEQYAAAAAAAAAQAAAAQARVAAFMQERQQARAQRRAQQQQQRRRQQPGGAGGAAAAAAPAAAAPAAVPLPPMLGGGAARPPGFPLFGGLQLPPILGGLPAFPFADLFGGGGA